MDKFQAFVQLLRSVLEQFTEVQGCVIYAYERHRVHLGRTSSRYLAFSLICLVSNFFQFQFRLFVVNFLFELRKVYFYIVCRFFTNSNIIGRYFWRPSALRGWDVITYCRFLIR